MRSYISKYFQTCQESYFWVASFAGTNSVWFLQFLNHSTIFFFYQQINRAMRQSNYIYFIIKRLGPLPIFHKVGYHWLVLGCYWVGVRCYKAAISLMSQNIFFYWAPSVEKEMSKYEPSCQIWDKADLSCLKISQTVIISWMEIQQ